MGHTAGKILVAALLFTLIWGGMAMAQEKAKMGLIVVDIQGDFTKLKNGSLAVDGTYETYIKAVEESTKKLRSRFSNLRNSGLAPQESRLLLYQP